MRRTVRMLSVAAGALVLLLLAASPAQAKCFSIRSVSVVGAPSAPGLNLSREQWGLVRSERSPAAIVLEGLLGRFPKEPDPPVRLGPRYRLIHVLDLVDIGTNRAEVAVLEQDLYPETSAGPMTFTPPQEWRPCGDRTMRIFPGWQAFPDELVENLRSFELPPPAEAPTAETPADRTPLLLTAATTVGGVATLLMARRRRRRPRAQPDRAA